MKMDMTEEKKSKKRSVIFMTNIEKGNEAKGDYLHPEDLPEIVININNKPEKKEKNPQIHRNSKRGQYFAR